MTKEKLQKRHEAEIAFHDEKYSRHMKGDYYAHGFKSIIFHDLLDLMGDIRGKKVLEFGCGTGWLTKVLATRGAHVWSFDISGEAVAKAREMMVNLDLHHNVHIDQMAAEKLTYNENMFDLAVGNAILHHLDQDSWMGELAKVLKPGGKALFMEPLGHNPLLNLYRKLTPSKRSSDEVPMSFSQFKRIEEFFSGFEHHEYYLISILSLLLFPLGFKKTTLSVRDTLHKFDRILLDRLPALSRYCWYSILEITN